METTKFSNGASVHDWLQAFREAEGMLTNVAESLRVRQSPLVSVTFVVNVGSGVVNQSQHDQDNYDSKGESMANPLAFERLKGLLDAWKKLKELGLDLNDLGELGRSAAVIWNAEGIPAKVKAAVEFVELFASKTTSTSDDDFAKLLRKLYDTFGAGFTGLVAQQCGCTTAATAVGIESVEASGFDWAVVMKIVRMLVELLENMS